MTNIEKIKAEIERQIKEECPLDTYEGRCKSCWANTLLTFVNSLIEEQPQGLEEAAVKYLRNIEDKVPRIRYPHGPEWLDIYDAFKAGARWDMQQQTK